jgi:hypothetical protein
LDVLGVDVVVRLVEMADGFEQTDGQERIDGAGHGRERGWK